MKFVLFDLDGTLCDSSKGIFNCFEYAFDKMNYPRPTRARLHECVGPPLLQSFMEFFNGDEKLALQGVNTYRERYSMLGWRECELYPGVEECLRHICDKGIKIGLATGKPQPFAENILKNFAIDGYFSCVVGSKLDNSFDDKGQIIALDLKLLGAKAEEGIMVGDRSQDMVGALSQGVTPVGIKVGFAAEGELQRSGARYVTDDFFTLKMLIDNIF